MTAAATRTLALAALLCAASLLAGCTAPRLIAPENKDEYYAQASIRLGQGGSVVLHFSVGPDGEVTEPITHEEPVVVGEPGDTPDPNAGLRLIVGAERFLRAARFDAHGFSKRELTASFVFEVKPCGKLAHAGVHDYTINLCRERAAKPWVDQP